MPSISKIRFTNVVYEDGMKRYNDDIFRFDGFNGAILLENGGGKTVFIQTALQAIIPHVSLADRKIKQTLQLDNYPAHIAIEWLLSEQPRRYVVTAVSLFLTKQGLDSHRYVYSYQGGDKHSIENIPFVKDKTNRPADRGEISEYYSQMKQQYMNAETFQTIKEFQAYIENQYHIIANEWESIVKINSTEGGVETFFDECKQTNQLFDRLLIPTVENSITGHDPNSFADTFEKHRSSFKLYKELKEQIEENRAIEENLTQYVKTYGGLYQKQQDYEQSKQHAKAIMDLIDSQRLENESALSNVNEKGQQLEADTQNLEYKQLSCNIQQENILLDKLNETLRVASERLSSKEDSKAETMKNYFSLKLAELKKDQEEEKDRIASFQKQLEEMDQEQEIAEIQDQLAENSQKLMGYFTTELENVQKQQQWIEVEKQSLQNRLDEETKKQKTLRNQLDEWRGSYHQNIGKLKTIDDEMNRIKKRILSNPDQEQVADRVSAWEERFTYLDEEKVSLKNSNNQLEKQMNEMNIQKENLLKEKDSKTNEQTSLEHVMKQADRAHQKVRDRLAGLRTNWANVDSVYLKEHSIRQQLDQKIHKLYEEREVLFDKERAAHRYLDDYGKQDLFFADSYTEKQIHQWRNQFSYLETGIQYINSLEESYKEQAKSYPLWPITLLTTKNELEQVNRKVQHIHQHIHFPIIVMTMEDALAIVQGKNDSNYPIVPEHWIMNQDITQFDEWKTRMANLAQKATIAREEVDRTLDHWNKGKEELDDFLKQYPYDRYQSKKEDLFELGKQVDSIRSQVEEIGKQIEGYENQWKSQLSRIDQYQNEYSGLQRNLTEGYRFLQYEKEKLELEEKQRKLSEKIDEMNKQMTYQQNVIEGLVEQGSELRDKLSAVKSNYNQLIEDPLYGEIKNFRPIFTAKSRKLLEEERQELLFAERKLSSTRNEVKIKLENAIANNKRIGEDIKELKEEQNELDEDVMFPSNGKEIIASLRIKIKELDQTVKSLKKEFDDRKEKLIEQKTVFDIANKELKRKFPNREPIQFSKSLDQVTASLQLEHKKLMEQRTYLDREKKRLEQVLKNIQEAFIRLDRFDEAHHFKGPSVVKADLTEEEIHAFTYDRISFVEKVTNHLKNAKIQVLDEWNKVEQVKESFTSFCKNKVKNVKMREMAIKGIESKKSYQAILEFQTNMQKRIQNAIKYNEMSIMDHDKQLEHFITHIHNHLRTIAQELELIPKKTKVKMEDKWKEIYKFSIPDWEEEVGKSRLREHIEWILEKIDSNAFLKEDGQEDAGKIRKEIEMWLQSKQLLRIVMNNEVMKVTCRKVTNENRVSKSWYSWEQSNMWSGGEKWSKNMTLFLGILNYVAEKQKHIEPNMKRHRVVIMDNPFGKASSDHVLNPVFFIAEQLGFQIIALTAHAEGKFLRDYFPVIYSCRLRGAVDSGKQIMTKEKQLHKAFFQDQDPHAMERLGEVEQMELF
ncbi:hypothetical protein [Ornithinibacillus sp. JPR2-1]|uniref:hypothetical protein n=1 Tax=Ornithinibacillus sp. JPR2-1 TaxID=2094019 RepID=UPI0031DD8C76